MNSKIISMTVPLNRIPTKQKWSMIWALISSLLGDDVEITLTGQGKRYGGANSATENGESSR